jgi:iron complex outermembrane receptor protein
MRVIKITRPCLLAALAMVPATAWAQTAPAGAPEATSAVGVNDIIVTAQKREENLQSVPIAVTAFSGDTLAERGVSDAQGLARLVPNMGFSNTYSQTRITLRGLSFQDLAAQGGEARVAYHVDGAYMAMTGDIGGTFYDIERVEVNRGPQGTLFGRNATAGTVNVITRNPTNVLSGYLNAEVGNYQTANVEGAISGPLADGLSARIAFQTRNHSGYDYNVPNDIDINNQRTQAIRGKIKLDKGSFTATLSADYFNENDRVGPVLTGFSVPGTPTVFASLGAQLQDAGPNPNPRHNYSGHIPLNDKESYGATLDMALDLTDSLSLVSLTNYRHSYFIYHDDLLSVNAGAPRPGSLIVSRQFEKAKQFSEEIRLTKDFERGNLVLGGFLYSQDYATGRQGPVGNAVLSQLGNLFGNLFGFPPGAFEDQPNIYVQGFLQGGAVDTRGEAIFGQATYEITDTTKLIVGARYSWERRTLHDAVGGLDLLTHIDDPTFVFPTGIGAKVSYSNFSPRVTIEQKLGPDAMIYATYAKGFKTGGFNVAQPPSSYLPENVTNYEGGFKADLFDGKLRLNGAGVYYDYKDLQTLTIVVAPGGAGSVNVNATAEVYGAELEATAVPVTGLELDLAAAVIHGEFTLGSLKGEKLPYMPSYTLSYGAQYTFGSGIGDLTLRGEGQTKGRTYFDNVNNPLNSQGAYTILNASLGWKDVDDRFTVTAFIKNITDKLASNGGFPLPGFLDGIIRGSWDPPRTYGVRFGVKF